MIGPEEIKRQALKWWKPLLQSVVNDEIFFPRVIDRIGKIQAKNVTQQFEIIQKEIEALYRSSKNQTGTGYLVKTQGRNFRRTGSHDLPDTIIFETVEDYLSVTGKKKEWRLFLANYQEIIGAIPNLSAWVLLHAESLADTHIKWSDILKVCHYFMEQPRPNLYLRQLPISVHTKFIEENNAIIQSLLDFLIPDHIRNVSQKRFAERYYLRHDQPLIRMRLLDAELTCFAGFSDISIPLADFEMLDIAAPNVLITENKMNFLALPSCPQTLAIWSSGGFQISYLKHASWLSRKNIFYWGDIDEHGFQILHQLRSYYPHSHSVMMDQATFEQFADFSVVGARNNSTQLSLLNEEENRMFSQLKTMQLNRLEQEKISQVYAEHQIAKILGAMSTQAYV